ncbi:MAG: hypothetical protein LBD23_00920 [Oscillospiraceae bacterium]|nr:hypothetical protein [Oscillospiraceae bacterium]
MSGEARALSRYNYGTAAPTIQAMVDAEARREQITKHKTPDKKEWTQRPEKPKTNVVVKAATTAKASTAVRTAKEASRASGISVLAALGAVSVAVLMVFVVLAQINYNETAAETVRLNTYLHELSGKYRSLELAFERAIDIKEVERFARDELGMSRPDTGQIIVISSTPRDIAIATNNNEERGIQGFGTFLRSLTEYFKNLDKIL